MMYACFRNSQTMKAIPALDHAHTDPKEIANNDTLF